LSDVENIEVVFAETSVTPQSPTELQSKGFLGILYDAGWKFPLINGILARTKIQCGNESLN
jgi:hypothetical protein